MKTFLDMYNEAVAAGAAGEDAARLAQEQWTAMTNAAAAEAEAEAKAKAEAEAAVEAKAEAEAKAKAEAEAAAEAKAKPELRAEDISVSRIPVQVLQQAGVTNGMSDEVIAARCLPLLVSLGW